MHQMSFGGQAPPGPGGGAYSASPDPVAALKWRLASCLRRSETQHSGSSFNPIRTLACADYTQRRSCRQVLCGR